MEAAAIILHMVGGGAAINFDHQNKYSVAVAVTVTVLCKSDGGSLVQGMKLDLVYYIQNNLQSKMT